MDILICAWKDLAHPRAGGAEVWTDGVARAWVDAGHRVTLATSAVDGRPDREDVHGVDIVRGGGYRHGVHAHARKLYRQRGGRFDLVVDQINTRPFGAPRWASESNVIAFIHQVAREVWFHETPLPLALTGRFVLEPYWLRPYRHVPVFCSSPSAAASLREYGITHAIALPQGCDLGPAQAFPKEETPTFAFVGRLSSMKRPGDVLEAFAQVRETLPDARLWMMGSGPEGASLRRRAGPGVEILGRVAREERDERVGRAHALLVTSVREGWGLVVSEAANVGTRSIAYDAPGLDDSVGATGGVLVAPRPDALADAMVKLARTRDSLPPPAGPGTVACAVVAGLLMDYAGHGEPRSDAPKQAHHVS